MVTTASWMRLVHSANVLSALAAVAPSLASLPLLASMNQVGWVTNALPAPTGGGRTQPANACGKPVVTA